MKIFANAEECRIEREIENQIVQTITGIGEPMKDAIAVARICINEAKKQIRAEGGERLPLNYGDVLLQREKTDSNVATELHKKRREGVTDEDIRAYWNTPELWRRTMDQLGQSLMYSSWKGAVGSGQTDDEAARYVRKFFPYWGDPDDTRVTSGDDRPLPVELCLREDEWVTKQRERSGDSAFKERCEKSSSFNAIIRAGRL